MRLPVPPLRHNCFSVNCEEHTRKHCLLKLTSQQWMKKDSNRFGFIQLIHLLIPQWMEKDSNRFGFIQLIHLLIPQWMEKDSNLRRRCQQIYSLPPLATRESIHVSDPVYQDLTITLYHIVIQIARTFFLNFYDILIQLRMSLAILPISFRQLPYILPMFHQIRLR